MNLVRKACSRAIRETLRITFPLFERCGIHVTPVHFYQPLPDTRQLKAETWKRQSTMPGVRMDAEEQLKKLRSICEPYCQEYTQFPLDGPSDDMHYYVHNGSFSETDGDILHCMLRHTKPGQVIEIGSGFSTHVTAHALEMNRRQDGVESVFTAIEPYPGKHVHEGIPGLSRLVPTGIQEVGLDVFEALGSGDVLFIDSTHVVKIGSDVCYEFLEILPRLKPGVIIHVHDIFLPFEYPEDWIKKMGWFWNEAYLLHAFLIHNDSFEILLANTFLRSRFEEEYKRLFPGRKGGSSFWLQKTK